MAKRRTYFRIRRIAAAELLRLKSEGQEVHAEALQWAEMTIAGIDDVGGRPPVAERQKILALLAEHVEDGRTPEQVAEALGPTTTVKTMQNVLYNLRQQGQCAVAKCMGRAFYFPTEAAAAAQRPRFERERQAVYDAARARRADAAKTKYQAKKPRTEKPQQPAPTPRQDRQKAVALPPAAPAKAPVHAEVIYPPNVKRMEAPTPRVLIDRFGVDPATRVEGGFHSEWVALRAGGGEA